MRKILLLLVTVLLLILALPFYIGAATPTEQPPQRAIIYMIDKLDFSDIDPAITPNLWAMQSEAGLGLLNTLSAGDRTSKNVSCTISAGKLAVGSTNADLNYKASEIVNGEKAGTVFFRNTGILPNDENIIVSSIAVIKKNNEKRNLGEPGQLGDQLHALGLKTAVIGNADLPGNYSRTGALIIMDSRGIVDNGLTGKATLQRSGSLPLSSNYEEIKQAFNNRFANQDVILVDFGDLTRLDYLRSLFTSDQFTRERTERLKQIDTCIGSLQEHVNSQDTVYVISPTPSHYAFERGELLTPLIIIKPNYSGVLTSYSTRREGIVSSISLKNSILHDFNPTIRDTIYASAATDAYTSLNRLNQRAVFAYVNQPWIVTLLIVIILSSLGLALIMLLKKKNPELIRSLILFALALPLSLLLIANLDIFNRWLFMGLALGINLFITLFCLYIYRLLKINPLTTVLLLTIVAIALDLLLSLGMLEQSMLSYRIISGSRYYGLGNEYMGILIGSTIAFTALFLQKYYFRYSLLMVAILFSFITFLIAYPVFGINVGGSITACIGLGYTYINYSKQRISFHKVVWLVLGTVALIAVMAIIDLKQPVEIQSHLGRSLNLICAGGGEEIVNIISRKLQMQLRIINYSIWGWLLLLLVLFSTYWVFRPVRLINMIKNQLPTIYNGLQGITMAAIIAIIVNDSGITAAAVLSLYFATLFLNFLNSQSG